MSIAFCIFSASVWYNKIPISLFQRPPTLVFMILGFGDVSRPPKNKHDLFLEAPWHFKKIKITHRSVLEKHYPWKYENQTKTNMKIKKIWECLGHILFLKIRESNNKRACSKVGVQLLFLFVWIFEYIICILYLVKMRIGKYEIIHKTNISKSLDMSFISIKKHEMLIW